MSFNIRLHLGKAGGYNTVDITKYSLGLRNMTPDFITGKYIVYIVLICFIFRPHQ